MNDTPKKALSFWQTLAAVAQGLFPLLVVGLIVWYFLWPSEKSKLAATRESLTAKSQQVESKKTEELDANWVRQLQLRSAERLRILNERDIVIIAVRLGLPPEKVHSIAEQFEHDTLSTALVEARLTKDKVIGFWTDMIAKLAKDSGLTERQVAEVLWDLGQIKDK